MVFSLLKDILELLTHLAIWFYGRVSTSHLVMFRLFLQQLKVAMSVTNDENEGLGMTLPTSEV